MSQASWASRRRFLVSTSAGLAAAALSLRPGRAARRPNVMVILADDLGSADLGCQGSPDIPTPHIDSLAAQGVRCTQAYASHPFCSPTRAGLLTGRYQQRFGHENNPAYLPEDETVGLPADQVSLPTLLQEAGYRTGWIGKWHLGATAPFWPWRRGFTETYGFLGGGHDYFKAGQDLKGPEYRIPLQRDGEPVEEREYLTTAFSREAADFVRRHQAEPFFLYLAYNAPHTPLQAPAEYLDRFKTIEDPRRRTYAAMVSALDDGVGRVLAALSQTDLERDTLVVFLSDNGGTPEGAGSNGRLRGAKGSVFEGGIKVPLLARWRGRLPEGRTFDQPLSSLDLLPTALAVAGCPLPRSLDGVDLMPHLSGESPASPHDRLFWRAGGGSHYAVREGRYKMVKPGKAAAQLYDLLADPSETRDLSGAEGETMALLQQAYDAWNRELVAPRWDNPKVARPRPAQPPA